MATGGKQAAAKPKTLTEYVVLERVDLPDETEGKTAHPNALYAYRPILNAKATEGPDGEVRIFKAGNDTQAIRSYAGTGADAIEGTFRAVSRRAWHGAETIRRTTTSERESIE